MAQFDVYENEEPDSKEVIPFLLDVQHDLHNTLVTRAVVPLVLVCSASEVVAKLCPRFTVGGRDVMMSTPEMAGYPAGELRNKVASLEGSRGEILAAIDFLLHGF
ncbi:plasmid maintenance protein CcdB [Geothermobacter hydrogeniphilus]|uniref:Toxin CcdB n=1 Tax=Geothermobacter hydrogeniphilus TaxID=1969733 RepID=A0A2K2HB50_9BACT|nr:CcdB family protein [Geothermobacter hydrogeniphilus]PNU20534.1 plasmid maintenance protein CcdB [Geothermobacter hydrogeniphilus]